MTDPDRIAAIRERLAAATQHQAPERHTRRDEPPPEEADQWRFVDVRGGEAWWWEYIGDRRAEDDLHENAPADLAFLLRIAVAAESMRDVLMARRNVLIDREILGTIDPEEAWELGCIRGAIGEHERAELELEDR
jgi:hypothetical protein